MEIPDPIELMEARIDRLMDDFDGSCMACHKKTNDLVCMSPIGDGPAVCAECAGLTHPKGDV